MLFEVNGPSKAKRLAVFLTLIGGRSYYVLRDLLEPDDPAAKTYYVVITVVKKTFCSAAQHNCRTFPVSPLQAMDSNNCRFLGAVEEISLLLEFGTF